MKKKIIAFIAAFAVLASLFAGCGNASDGMLIGKWAYIHEPETTILAIKSNGTAFYKEKKYDCLVSDGFIVLNDGTESFKLRYFENDNGFDLYEQSTYIRTSEGDGIVGTWECNNETFEFTEDGTFQEDGIFPGHYVVSEDGSTVKLAYNDPIEDTILYVAINGNEMFVEYPWPMVPATK